MLAIHQLLLVMGQECAMVSVNPQKLLKWIMETVYEGAVYMAILDGHLIGTVGLGKVAPRWSDDSFLGDQWAFVLRQHRNGSAWTALKNEIQKLSDATGMKAVIKRMTSARGTIIFTPRTPENVLG